MMLPSVINLNAVLLPCQSISWSVPTFKLQIPYAKKKSIEIKVGTKLKHASK